MAFPPTTLTINTSSGTVSISIPTGSNAVDMIQNIVKAGGVMSPQSEGAEPNSMVFTPLGVITSITAS